MSAGAPFLEIARTWAAATVDMTCARGVPANEALGEVPLSSIVHKWICLVSRNFKMHHIHEISAVQEHSSTE